MNPIALEILKAASFTVVVMALTGLIIWIIGKVFNKKDDRVKGSA